MEHATFPEAARAGRFELDEQELAIREMAQDFALAEIAPHGIEWDQEKIFPVETLRAVERQVQPALPVQKRVTEVEVIVGRPEVGGSWDVIGRFPLA